ncbi:MAG: ABC transporter permease subunit [Methanocalculus sp.]|uniref:ABC transporter permease n=1 Tax=Methanocalculus sp. TaxID=2004547 RepID=UPI00271FCBF3|nr:ABC transporter permease subunit [Methanocalculus sp.]MDO9539114.1 ABC transporter permease subunit [Methanocalculus sp.]
MSNALFVIAEKEFSDSFRNRTILAIFAIFFAISVIGIIGGIAEYQDTLDSYNELLSTAGTQERGLMDTRPSPMIIFGSVGALLVTMGALLGITSGFDLITRERETKSLKVLLSHPVFRDEVINGKAIGAGGALALIFAATIAVSIALMLITGIVPGGDEWSSIAIFSFSAFLMIIAYFAIALCMSAISETSGTALVYTLIIFILLSGLLPVLIENGAADAIAGDAPTMPRMIQSVSIDSREGGRNFQAMTESEDFQKYREDIQDWRSRRQAVVDIASLFSPTMSFDSISDALTSTSSMTVTVRSGPGGGMIAQTQASDTSESILSHLLALLAFPAIFFGIAYMRFMRMDLR